MADVKITVKRNGPLFLEGAVDIFDADGNPIPVDPAKKGIALCRCGYSMRKPFCDGGHNRCSWNAETPPPVLPPPPTVTTLG